MSLGPVTGHVLPALADVLDGAAVVTLPLRVRFRGLDEREALLLRGPAGWGEFAPFAEYDDAESAPWLAAGLEAAWTGPPVPLRDRVSVNATVPAVHPDAVPGVLATFPGCTTVKVKVAQQGQRLADDLARVAAVRDVLGPGAAVRVDANGGWTLDEALAALTALAGAGPLQYAEQPCASVEELTRLRTELTTAGAAVPIAADESIRRARDPVAVARAGAADVAVLKVPPLGGARAVVDLAATLEDGFGMRVVVSSALDTAVGIGAGLAAAAALAREPLACGLATGSLLARDVATARPIVDGAMEVAAVPARTDLLERSASPGPRRDWWLARLERCWTVLERQRLVGGPASDVLGDGRA